MLGWGGSAGRCLERGMGGYVKIERQWELGLSLVVKRKNETTTSKTSFLSCPCMFFYMLYREDQNVDLTCKGRTFLLYCSQFFPVLKIHTHSGVIMRAPVCALRDFKTTFYIDIEIETCWTCKSCTLKYGSNVKNVLSSSTPFQYLFLQI